MTDKRKQNYENDFYVDHLQGGGRKRRSISHVGLFLIVFVCFAVILWVTYPRGAEKYNMMEVPIIRADTESYKEKPVNRGGLEVLHQDSSVFEPLGDIKTKSVEHLLPQSEDPVDRKSLRNIETAEKSERVLGLKLERRSESLFDRQVINKLINQDSFAETAANTVVEEAPVIGDALSQIDKKLTEQVIEEKNVKKTEAASKSKSIFIPAPKPKALAKKVQENLRWQKKTQQASRVEYVLDKKTSTVQKIYYPHGEKRSATGKAVSVQSFIQLGAFRTRRDAEKRWIEILSKNSDLLYKVKSRVQYANLGKKGIYYRLQAGPLSQKIAISVCNSLKKRKIGGCILVKP